MLLLINIAFNIIFQKVYFSLYFLHPEHQLDFSLRIKRKIDVEKLLRIVDLALAFQDFFAEMKPDLDHEDAGVLRVLVQYYVVDFNAKIFHLYGHSINFINVECINIIQLVEELSQYDNAEHVNWNNEYADTFLMEPIMKWNLNFVILAAYNCNELRTCFM